MLDDTEDMHLEDVRDCKNGSPKSGLEMGDFHDRF